MQFSSMFSSFAIFKASFLRWPSSIRISSRSSTPLPIETTQPHGAREASSHTSTIRGCKGWNRAQGSGLVLCLLSRPHHQFRRRPSLGFRWRAVGGLDRDSLNGDSEGDVFVLYYLGSFISYLILTDRISNLLFYFHCCFILFSWLRMHFVGSVFVCCLCHVPVVCYGWFYSYVSWCLFFF